MKYKLLFYLLLWSIGIDTINAQHIPIGTWQTHLPYSNTNSVAVSKDYLYASSQYAVFSYNLHDGSIKKYSKSEGLSDVGVSCIGYDTTTSSLIIAYSNSNVDILQDGKVTNLPYIMKANIVGGKQINKVFTSDGTAWLATNFGIVELRLNKLEIGDTYFFTNLSGTSIKVNDLWASPTSIYAATQEGLYVGERVSAINLSNFQNWQLWGNEHGLLPGAYTAVTGRDEEVFAASGDVIYRLENNLFTPYYALPVSGVNSLFKGKNRLLVAQNDHLSIIPDHGSPQDISGKFYISRPQQIIETSGGRIFYADLFRMTLEYISPNQQTPIVPNGPGYITCKGIDFLNNQVFVGSSPMSTSFFPTFNANGFYTADDFFWKTYTATNLSAINGAFDIAVIQSIPSENIVLMGAHNTGLLEYNPETQAVKFIHNFPNATSNLRITAASRDPYNNVWLTNAYSTQPLICRKPDGSYLIFSSPLINNKLINGIAIDDYQQIWMTITDGGIVVFNYGNTLEDKSDDQYITFTTTPGAGGLPTNSVTSIAKDLNGEIWIGSTEGVAYVPCPGAVFDRTCDAGQICIPRNDGTNFCDLLLETETINAIAVDAGNRKWFGTNNGIFLESEDGLKNLASFNERNSPLLSDKIRSIGIHPYTGDVYFLTEKGIVSFRGEATEKSASNEKPHAYPNPVRPNYTGTIAIQNLPDRSHVKITDAAGRLVVDGQALGSQYIWDGKDTNGHKVASGIYYVLAVGANQKDKVITKIAFIK